jgi:hypothetical protein
VTPLDVAVIVGGFVAVGLGIRAMRAIWRNEWRWSYDPDHEESWWPRGGALWRGWIRLTPLSIVLFNRPKFLVVAHLRSQHGALAEWATGLRNVRAAPRERSGRR